MVLANHIQRIGCGRAQIVPFLVCFLSTMADSFEMILLAFIGPMVRCEWQCSSFEEAALTTVVFLGMILGGFVWGTLADHYHFGRKHCIVWANALTFSAGFASAFSPNIHSLIVLRGILGIGIAGNTLMPFTLFMETIPSDYRGTWSSAISWSWSTGAVLVVFLAWQILPTYGWRYLVLVVSFPGGICLLLSLTLLYESPFFLAMHNKDEELSRTLCRMAEQNNCGSATVYSIKNDKKRYEKKPLLHRQRCQSLNTVVEEGGISALFAPDIWTTTLRLWFVWFSCAFCYYGTILITTMFAKDDDSWSSTECQQANDEWGNSATASYVFPDDAYMDILNSTWGEFAAAVTTTLFLDYLGRKFIMTAAFLVFSSMFVIIAFSESASGDSDVDDSSASTWFTVVLFFARTAAAVVLTPTVYVYTSEIYTTAQRAAGLSMGYIFARIGGVLAPFIGQALFETSYFASTMSFAIVGFIAALFSYSFTQRTSGVTLRH